MDDEKQKITAEALAADILTLARNELTVGARFLAGALSRLELVPTDKLSFGTDGRHLFYDPWVVLSWYKAEREGVARGLLHTLLHCVFRHSLVGRDVDQLRWNLACDAAVENAVNGMELSCVRAGRRAAQQEALSVLAAELRPLTAEKLYRRLGELDLDEGALRRFREVFFSDVHSLWFAEGEDGREAPDKADVERMWVEVSRRMQTELETMREDKDSALVQNLRSLHRARVSYTDFLRRFGVYGEVVRLSDEEYDNIFYTYGLSLYGNMPLIEPLEYRESRRIRQFVIAIDTSGSVRGDVVQSFIQHTHDILTQQESFFTKVDLHILQCDDAVRDDARITCREEFDEYLRHMEIRGLGQTDFRPVFAYVDGLRRKGELGDLRGLIYFTDGLGTFPAKKPAYDTAFILHRSDYEEPEVPDWAMRLTLLEDDILDGRFSN